MRGVAKEDTSTVLFSKLRQRLCLRVREVGDTCVSTVSPSSTEREHGHGHGLEPLSLSRKVALPHYSESDHDHDHDHDFLL